MLPGRDTKFAYAVGRIRVLETRLLDKGKLDRMVESPTIEESIKVLGETDYAAPVAAMASFHDYETVLRDEIGRAYNTIAKISPQPELTGIIALQYDIHNMKVLFKAHFLGEDSNAMLFPVGTIPTDRIKSMIAEGSYVDLPPSLRAAAERISEEFIVSRDPQIIDLYLDRALYELLMTTAQKAGSKFLEGLFVRQADLLNVKTFLRIKRMGRGREALSKALLPHGTIAAGLFLNLLEEPAELLADRLAMTDYAAIVSEGIREWQSEGSLTRFEKLADNLITAYLKRGKRIPFGLEPLIGYIFAKEVEVKNIRMVMVGKINRLPTESIRERLRDVYV